MSLKPPILTVGKFEFYAVSETGMSFVPETPRAQWIDAVKRLTHFYEGSAMAKERCLMLLADALNFGEAAYGEDYTQAVDGMRQALGLSPKTISNAKWAFGKIDVSLRKEGITLHHYNLIAALEPGEQARFIDEAIQKQMTIRELRDEIAVAHPKTKRGKTRATKTLIVDLESEEGLLHAQVKISEWLLEQAKNKVKLRAAWKSALQDPYLAYRRCFISKG
jgi:hypothetical protein